MSRREIIPLEGVSELTGMQADEKNRDSKELTTGKTFSRARRTIGIGILLASELAGQGGIQQTTTEDKIYDPNTRRAKILESTTVKIPDLSNIRIEKGLELSEARQVEILKLEWEEFQKLKNEQDPAKQNPQKLRSLAQSISSSTYAGDKIGKDIFNKVFKPLKLDKDKVRALVSHIE